MMQRVCPFCGTAMEQEPVQPGQPPASDPCPTCGQEVDRPFASVSYTPPVHPEYTPRPGPDSPAWEGEGNFIARIWRTIWQVFLHPVRTFSAPAQPGLKWALSFGIILGTLGGAAYIFWGWLLRWESLYTSYEFWLLIAQPLGAIVNLFVLSAVIHVFLWILRGAKNGFSATFRVLGYAQATCLFFLIPWVGMPVGAVWSLVVLIAGLAAAHGIGRWRVFWALFLPFVVIIMLVVLTALVLGVGALLDTGTVGGFLGF